MQKKEIGTSQQLRIVDSVYSVATRRNVSRIGKNKIDVEKLNPRETEMAINGEILSTRGLQQFCLGCIPSSNWNIKARTRITYEYYFSIFDVRIVMDWMRNGVWNVFAHMLMLVNRFKMDIYHDDWRLDIDDMSYEQLLALTDRIGYETTGLKEDEIGKCISKFKLSELSCQIRSTVGKKCTVCQEELEGDEELGKLECGHGFHLECIKQWLANKNNCPELR
ncbi:Probable E3 ubiquitin-protein ligase HIP1 [Linum grandiflorum]